MKNFKLIIIGHLMLSLPYALIFTLLYIGDLLTTGYLMIFFIIGWLYWSFMTPVYKYLSIKSISTKEEYYRWVHLATNTLLFWPNDFFFTQFEYWNENKADEYKDIVSRLK